MTCNVDTKSMWMVTLQVDTHFAILGTKLRFVPIMAKWGFNCNHNYLYRWLPCQYFILLMMGAWRPKHVEKVCSNKTCILLHHVGVLFNLILWCTKANLEIDFILLMMGAWRPKHVEKVCSNKTCILLHHVGVLFNLMSLAVWENAGERTRRAHRRWGPNVRHCLPPARPVCWSFSEWAPIKLLLAHIFSGPSVIHFYHSPRQHHGGRFVKSVCLRLASVLVARLMLLSRQDLKVSWLWFAICNMGAFFNL